jgi:preprotein translocase subunit SecE
VLYELTRKFFCVIMLLNLISVIFWLLSLVLDEGMFLLLGPKIVESCLR